DRHLPSCLSAAYTTRQAQGMGRPQACHARCHGDRAVSALPEAGGVRFRPMSEADLEAVMQNERASYSHPWSEGIFRDCMHSGYNCWVAETQASVVGHGVMSVAVGETHILNIC